MFSVRQIITLDKAGFAIQRRLIHHPQLTPLIHHHHHHHHQCHHSLKSRQKKPSQKDVAPWCYKRMVSAVGIDHFFTIRFLYSIIFLVFFPYNVFCAKSHILAGSPLGLSLFPPYISRVPPYLSTTHPTKSKCFSFKS